MSTYYNGSVDREHEEESDFTMLIRRMVRLERTFLLFAANISGELHRVGTQEEIANAMNQFVSDMAEMRADVEAEL